MCKKKISSKNIFKIYFKKKMYYDYIKKTPIKAQNPKDDWWGRFEKIICLMLI